MNCKWLEVYQNITDRKGRNTMKKFVCSVCGHIHTGDAPPEKCPICHVPASKFVEKTD